MVKKSKSFLKKELSLKIINSLTYTNSISLELNSNWLHLSKNRIDTYEVNFNCLCRYVTKKDFIKILITEFSLLDLQFMKLC